MVTTATIATAEVPALEFSTIASMSVNNPYGVAVDASGNVWFTNYSGNSIGKIATNGAITEFKGNGISAPFGIVADASGNVWFTNYSGNSIGKIATNGTVTNKTDATISRPTGITVDPTGNIWFSNYSGNSIGKIATNGTVTNKTDATIAGPTGITVDPTGNIWFTNYEGNSIGKIATNGTVMNKTDATIAGPMSIDSDAAGNVWFTNLTGNSIGKIATNGTVTNKTDATIAGPMSIDSDAAGNVWFTNYAGASIGRIATNGTVTKKTDPAIYGPFGLAVNAAGTVWFTDQGHNSVGRIATNGTVTTLTESKNLGVTDIVGAENGDVWFANPTGGEIGHIAPDKTITYVEDPKIDEPQGVAIDSSGRTWFTDAGNDTVGRINSDGTITQFTAPWLRDPEGITVTSDGTAWFVNYPFRGGGGSADDLGAVGFVKPDGTVGMNNDAIAYYPGGITSDAADNVWFATVDRIWKIAPDGTTTYKQSNDIWQPRGITVDSAGVVWFANYMDNSIGRLDTDGSLSFTRAPEIKKPVGIVADGVGNIWFTNRTPASVGQINEDGDLWFHNDPNLAGPGPLAITSPDNLWIVNGGGSSVMHAHPVRTQLDVPLAPRNVEAASRDSSALVSWTAPFDDGGSPITGYTAVASPGNATCTTSGATSCLISGLENGFTYTISVTATNAIGDGPAGLSAPVRPQPNLDILVAADQMPRAFDYLAADHDGAIWYTIGDIHDGVVGTLSPDPGGASYSLETKTDPALAGAGSIAVDASGTAWITAYRIPLPGLNPYSALVEIAPGGLLTAHHDNAVSPGNYVTMPGDVNVGDNGDIWFINGGTDGIGRWTPDGAFVERVNPSIRSVKDLTVDPDGNIWYTAFYSDELSGSYNRIGRIAPNGTWTEFDDPLISGAREIVADQGGSLWFVNNSGRSIDKMSPDGSITPVTGNQFNGAKKLAVDPDGNIWFIDFIDLNTSAVRVLTPTGGLMTFSDPRFATLRGLTVDPTGNVWVSNDDSIMRLSFAAPAQADPPSAPRTPSATAGNTQATVAWTVPASDGGSAITSYKVTSTPGSKTCTTTGALTCTVTGLTNGTAYTFKVTATNVVGTSPASVASNSVIPAAPTTVPSAPRTPSATAGNTQATVAWTVPASDGGSPITSYTVTSTPGSKTCTTTGALSCVVSGLTNDIAYTFKVTATNVVGTSPASVASNSVTPTAPVDPVLTGAFHPMAPSRIIDSRPSSRVGPYSTPWGQGTTRDISVATVAGVPGDATGVVLNVTAVSPSLPTYLTIWPKGQSRPTASNLNVPPGDVRPNLVMAKLGTDGKVSLYNNLGNTHVVVDVVGWYGPGSDASLFNELSPARIWDTRSGPGATGRIGQAQTKNLKVTGVGGVPGNATAVVMNVTAVNPTAPTYLTAWPKGSARPTASNLNVPPGEVRPNLVVAKVGANGEISFYNNLGTVDVVVDVVGYFAPTGSQFSGMTPVRVWDSRPAPENVGPLGRLGQGQSKAIQVAGTNGVPADAKAVVVNITGVSPTLPTYITAWPTGESRPTASNLNLTPNTVIPNLAVVKVGSNGRISFYNNLGTTDIVVDIVGWYS